jgi:phosphoribosylamine--glycine ligase
VETASEKGIDLTVVGPEAPLADGIANRFLIRGMQIFGSTQKATEIESSKVFSKELMQKYNIPCARSISFSDYEKAKEYLQSQKAPIVVKADGLAAGKGVIVAESLPQALDALSRIMQDKAFGAAGDRVIIEEYLSGREMSVFAFSDGYSVVPMMAACDYKPAFDGNKGPNTGGMGSYSPPPFLTPALAKTVQEKVMVPAVKAMHEEGRPYRGILYGGLMIGDGEPKVLEFNARFGDPETQVILPLLSTDLVEILLAVIQGNLEQLTMEWTANSCVGVVMASGGYPGKYETGYPIKGFDNLDEDLLVFHAGTRLGNDGQVYTNGGRVLTLVSVGEDMAEARARVYRNLPSIQFEGCHYRKDIALREIG